MAKKSGSATKQTKAVPRTEWRALAQVQRDPANERLHPDENVAAIARSLRQFGQLVPCVVDAKGVLKKGNGTHLALERIAREGGTSKADPAWIWVTEAELSEQDLAAYRVADNRTAELASWDPRALAATYTGLQAVSYPVEVTGFSPAEIERLTRDAAKHAPASAAEPGASTSRVVHTCPSCGHEWSAGRGRSGADPEA